MKHNLKSMALPVALAAAVALAAWQGDALSGRSMAQAELTVREAGGASAPGRAVKAAHRTPGGRGQYWGLLKKLHVPQDSGSYGDFYDYGYWSGTAYAGHADLPPGYWVYLAPDWYIFKEARSPAAKRRWGPEQATGKPDTPQAGDIPTAWASKTADGQAEWLELRYDQSVSPLAVLVYETYNPGALCRVTVFDGDREEITVWSGSDPTPPGQGMGISVVPFQTSFKVSRVRLYLNSPRVKGWNEIDAVGLLDTAGQTHWAAAATASSTYAE